MTIADGGAKALDPQDDGDLLVAELLPGDEAEELLVGRRERGQGLERRPVLRLADVLRGRHVADLQERGQTLAAADPASLVGEHPTGDGV